MKKLIPILIAAAMFMLAATGLAAQGEYTVTVANDTPGHTYSAYQLFAGDLSVDENDVPTLSNIVWGDGVNGEALLAALKADADMGAFDSATTAAQTAEILAGFADDSAELIRFAKLAAANTSAASGNCSFNDGKYSITGLAAGYYIIKDSAVTGYDSTSDHIVEVVKNVSVIPKDGVPTVTKKVYEHDIEAYNDVADYGIGDAVQFKLTATLPENLDAYKSYCCIFRDTQSSGLTFDASSVVVTLGDTQIPPASYAVVTEGLTGDVTFEVRIDDIKAIDRINADSGSDVTVTYISRLNANAVTGLPGNPNSVELLFSNDPNGEGMGTTPEDKVIVFAYGLDIIKVDGQNTEKKLAGAAFIMYRDTQDGGVEYALIENGMLTGWTAEADDASKLITDSSGMVGVRGLEDGLYYLEETNSPVGYNLLAEPVTALIAAETANGQNWTGLPADALTAISITATVEGEAGQPDAGSANDGMVSVTVANNAGAILPTTGGVGTTIFVIAGSALMLAAVVVLAARIRLSGRDE